MAIDADTAQNITKVFSSIFQEIASDESTNRSTFDLYQFLSSASLRIQTKNISHEHFDFGALVKLVNGLKNKLNLTKSPESTCDYCSGSFRDIVLAYNSIHGYFSLLVSKLLFLF